MNWHDTPQQAIEDYLDALLHDDLEESLVAPSVEQQEVYDEYPSARFSESYEEPYEESLQARQLSESMLQFKQASQPLIESFAKPVLLDDPFVGSQVILPNINLPSFEPAVETLADVVQEIETAQALQQEVETFEEVAIEEFVEEELIEEEFVAEEEFVEEIIEEAFVEEVEIENFTETTTQEESFSTPSEGQPPSPPGWKDGRPVWAQERFECLLFKVKGLTLAVPLVELGGIIKIEKQPTPLFGQPSWFIGMLRNNKMNVSMVDTAQWVLPPALIKKIQDPYKLVIRIHDSTWGLACNEVDRSISLKPEQVRWRTSLGKRPWLAGTVIEHMCALIDVAAFARLLKEGHGDLEPINLKALNNIK